MIEDRINRIQKYKRYRRSISLLEKEQPDLYEDMKEDLKYEPRIDRAVYRDWLFDKIFDKKNILE